MTPTADHRSIYPHAPDRSWRGWVEVDLDVIVANARALAAHADLPLVAMVKADAYGLGAVPVAQALRAANVPLWAFGVATLDEAAELRTEGIDERVLCTTPLLLAELSRARTLGVTPALHRAEDITAWSALGGGAWHLAIDTGMSRAGVPWDAAHTIERTVAEHPPQGVFHHFHSADHDTASVERQHARFTRALDALAPALPADLLIHSANSAAIARRGRERSGDHLVRPGIGLYGAAVTPWLPLASPVRWCAHVIDVREIGAGESVSYDARFLATRASRVATVSCGHADGLRRLFSNRGVASVRGESVPILGVVTMDMVMVDVTALPHCHVGDVATFLDPVSMTPDAFASLAEMSPYELLVGLKLRMPRVYRGHPHAAPTASATR